jgi:glycosyltransferase involved in cell wall biosynthesis
MGIMTVPQQTAAVNDKPLVTALINTFNYARYLPFAINSVLSQTYDNIELVIVDDGSFDHTAEVLAPYADKARIIVCENGGQGNAFNVGIAAARGELIMFLDADDIWLPTKVERMVALASDHPDCDFLYHKFVNVDAHGNEAPVPQPEWMVSGRFEQVYLRAGGHYWHPITSVLALRAEYARSLLPLPTYAVREGADSILSDASMLLAKVASCEQVLARRLLHGANLYAQGREEFDRKDAVRQADVRRIEWRFFYLEKLLARFGYAFAVDPDRNEWRMINLYLTGKVPLRRIVRAVMVSPDPATLKQKIGRLVWLRKLRLSLLRERREGPRTA